MTQLDARPQAGDTVRGSAPADGGVREKGLGGNSVGLMGSAVIGVSTVTPVYCLTSTLGSTADEVGVQLVVLAVFVAMAVRKAGSGDFTGSSVDFSWSWLNPFAAARC
jgi:hypothetical protein